MRQERALKMQGQLWFSAKTGLLKLGVCLLRLERLE